MTIDTLPWDAVSSDSEDVPFESLEQIAAALPHDEAVLDRLADVYDAAQERDWQEGGFEFIYVPGILSLAAPNVGEQLLEELIMLLLEWLDEAEEQSDLDFEILSDALQAIGPAILPRVVRQLRERDPAESQSFHLRGLLTQVAKTEDPSLRGPAIEYCRETIDAALVGNFDPNLAIDQAWTLLTVSEPGLREKVQALEQICRDDTRSFDFWASEYRHMLDAIDGKTEMETLLGSRRREIRDWITQYQQMFRDWRSRPDTAQVDEEATDSFLDSPLPNVDGRCLQPILRDQPRVGRNDPCLCGSGKKYKKCCGR